MLLAQQRVLAIATVVVSLTSSAPLLAHQRWLIPSFFTHVGETTRVSFAQSFGDRRFFADPAPGL